MSEGGIPKEQAPILKTESAEIPKAFAGSELMRLVDAQREENGFSMIRLY